MARFFYCLLAMLFSTAITASDLALAQEFFDKRDQDRGNIHEAQRMYLKIIKDKNRPQEHRAKALSMYARLSIFEGEVGAKMHNVSQKESAKIFEECIDATDYLSPKKLGHDLHIPEYVYYRLVCIGLWGSHIKKARLVTVGLPRVMEITSLLAYGQKHFKDYDNYGFDRIEAGIYIHDESLAKFKLYDPERSLRLVNEAIENGQEVHVACLLKSQVLLVLNRKKEAIKAVQAGIQALELKMKESSENSIESRLFLENMNAEFARLSRSTY